MILSRMIRGSSILSACVAAAILPLFAGLAANYEQRVLQAEIAHRAFAYRGDIAQALIDEDWVFLEDFTHGFVVPGVASAITCIPSGKVFGGHSEEIQKSCFLPVRYPMEHYGMPLGTVRACLAPGILLERSLANPWLLLLLAYTCITCLGFTYWYLHGYRRSLLHSIRALRHWANHDARSPLPTPSDPVAAQVLDLVRDRVERQIVAERQAQEGETWRRLGEQAANVAHDIRSPLSALASIMPLVAENEPVREVANMAIGRIRHVADDLLVKRKEASERRSGLYASQPQLVEPAVKQVLTELRIRFAKSRPEVDLLFAPSGVASELAVIFPAGYLERIMANLVANAVEAIEGVGEVSVDFEGTNDHMACICISDNGKGMPPELLARMGQRGASFGKEAGNGLGAAR